MTRRTKTCKSAAKQVAPAIVLLAAQLLASNCSAGGIDADTTPNASPTSFDMSLIQLLDLRVNSAARAMTTWAMAPSIMTVFTANP